MANKAAINATPEVKALRNVARIKTLRTRLEQAEATDHTRRPLSAEKISSMRAELQRREAEVEALKAALDSI